MAARAGISSGVAVFSGCRPVRAGVGLRDRKECQPKAASSLSTRIDRTGRRRRQEHQDRLPRSCPGWRVLRRHGRVGRQEGRYRSGCEYRDGGRQDNQYHPRGLQKKAKIVHIATTLRVKVRGARLNNFIILIVSFTKAPKRG